MAAMPYPLPGGAGAGGGGSALKPTLQPQYSLTPALSLKGDGR